MTAEPTEMEIRAGKGWSIRHLNGKKYWLLVSLAESESGSAPVQSSSTEVQALRDRVSFLESRQQQVILDGAGAPGTSSGTLRSGANPNDAGHGSVEGRPSPRTVRQNDQQSPVYTIIGPTESAENREGFFGSSSAGTFMQNVSAAVEQRLRGIEPESRHFLQAPDQGRTEPWSPNRQAPKTNGSEHSLPLKRTADQLMSIYWQDVHSVFPILDQQNTHEQYGCLWTGEGEVPDHASFLCLINAIFALASQLNPAVSPGERSYKAAQYYSKAMDLLDIWEKPSLQTAQSLVLLAMYCQSSNEAHQCWMLSGMSIRVSQALGLHLPGASERAQDARTRELFRRVWHGCVQLDRTVSMTYGRPCGVSERLAVAVPLPETNNEPDGASTMTLHYYSLCTRLYSNLHEVLYSLGAPGVIQVQSLDELYDRYFRHWPTDPNKPSVIDIEGSLQRWHGSIPNDLRADNYQSTSDLSSTRRQAVILEQNFLHVRLLLLRPFLSAVIALDPDERPNGTASLSIAISLQCATTCVRVAQDSLKLIHQHRSQDVGSTGSTATWWFNVLFIYTAATVLNASLLSPTIVNELTEVSILESWHLALAMLDEYTVFGEHIKRLVTTLRVLFHAVPKQYSQHRRAKNRQQTQPDHLANPGMGGELHQTGLHLQRPADQPMLSASTPLQIEQQALDWNQQNDGLWDLGFDTLDLAWLTSLPTDFVM
ncbi:hypothetical protein PRZ48_014711 [Zasmidium cellare]|uniref:Xylanolytic transcriptional activator regulatory domain-containing protein n=1 Tax=Zasmidium cellare TaxID=395010 RepID=A0ABR0DZR8_ZASCE|nr:hypothetical protein PRZ48_014711 [Zasmidium cellare]